MGLTLCECSDPGCANQIKHYRRGDCRQPVAVVYFRVDMDDKTGTAMCDACAEDAWDTGLFTTVNPQGGQL